MYYAEKIIDGELHFKTTPNGEWQPFSTKTLTVMIVSMRKELVHAEERIDRLEKSTHEPL